jgi:hypothetical protein
VGTKKRSYLIIHVWKENDVKTDLAEEKEEATQGQ